ncbi:unnamed protein product [Lathyrus oleraceus]
MTYAQLLPYLVQQGAIVPKEIPSVVYPYGPKYNPIASCAFHAGYIGHSIEDCGLFKSRVHELIDQKVLSFSEVGPNVITDPLPNHYGQVVNAVSGDGCSDSVASSEEYKG